MEHTIGTSQIPNSTDNCVPAWLCEASWNLILLTDTKGTGPSDLPYLKGALHMGPKEPCCGAQGGTSDPAATWYHSTVRQLFT